jgi:hypothetical protein
VQEADNTGFILVGAKHGLSEGSSGRGTIQFGQPVAKWGNQGFRDLKG